MFLLTAKIYLFAVTLSEKNAKKKIQKGKDKLITLKSKLL